MDKTNNDILQSMRLMAWERAKGELNSISQASYLSSMNQADKIDRFRELYEEFVKNVEGEGLIEGV